MIVVVDTNILFSACLTPAGRAFEVLFNGRAELITSRLALEELTRHRQKLFKLSKLSNDDLETLIALVVKQVSFIEETIIETHHWQAAHILTKDVDSNDIAFVALALETGGMLWTGDKKLSDHLKEKGFDRVVTTAELANILHIQ